MLSDVGCHVMLKENDYTSIEIRDLGMFEVFGNRNHC